MSAPEVLFAVISTAVLLALATYIFLAARGSSLTLYYTLDVSLLSWRSKLFLALAAIGFLICMYSGASTMLYWMPTAWGSLDSEGEFQTDRSSLAATFAMFGGVALIVFIDKATHEKFFLRKRREHTDELNLIFDIVLTGRSFNALRQKYLDRVGELKAGPISSDIVVGRYSHPDAQRLLMYYDLISLVDSLQRMQSLAASQLNPAMYSTVAAVALKELGLVVEAMSAPARQRFERFLDENRPYRDPRSAALSFLVDEVFKSFTVGSDYISNSSRHVMLTNAETVVTKWKQDGHVTDNDVRSNLDSIRSSLAMLNG